MQPLQPLYRQLQPLRDRCNRCSRYIDSCNRYVTVATGRYVNQYLYALYLFARHWSTDTDPRAKYYELQPGEYP